MALIPVQMWSPTHEVLAYTTPTQNHVGYHLSLSSLSILDVKLRSSVCLELIFVQGDRYWSNSVLLHVCIDYHLLKMVLSFPVGFFFFWYFCQISDGYSYETHVWVFCVVPLLYVSAFAGTTLILLLWYMLRSAMAIYLVLFLLLRIAFIILGLLWFCKNVRIIIFLF